MVGITGSRLLASQLDLNEIRHLRLKGVSMDKIAGTLGVCRQTIGALIKKHDLDGKFSDADYAHCDVLHHFMRNSARLDDPSISQTDYARISGIHARQASLLMRGVKGKSQMVGDKPRRKFEDLSDDELRAVLVKLFFDVETKGELGKPKPREFGPTGELSVRATGETFPKTAAD